MDLFAKVIIFTLIALVVAAVVILVGTKIVSARPQLNATESQAFVSNYIGQTYPNAKVYPINVTKSNLTNSSWDVFVGIVYNYTRACPTIEIEDFDYPAVNVVARTDDLYSRGWIASRMNCSVSNGAINLGNTKLPAAALIDAYRASSGAQMYVSRFGYSNVLAYAKFFGYQCAQCGSLSNIWIVNYTSPMADYTEYVVLNESGGFVKNYTSLTNAG